MPVEGAALERFTTLCHFIRHLFTHSLSQVVVHAWAAMSVWGRHPRCGSLLSSGVMLAVHGPLLL
jgi:hypothetical protein